MFYFIYLMFDVHSFECWFFNAYICCRLDFQFHGNGWQRRLNTMEKNKFYYFRIFQSHKLSGNQHFLYVWCSIYSHILNGNKLILFRLHENQRSKQSVNKIIIVFIYLSLNLKASNKPNIVIKSTPSYIHIFLSYILTDNEKSKSIYKNHCLIIKSI